MRLADAQAERELAEAKKLKAEAELILAQAEKTKADIYNTSEKPEQINFMESGKTNIQEIIEHEKLTVADELTIQKNICKLERCAGRICSSAAKCDLAYKGETKHRIG